MPRRSLRRLPSLRSRTFDATCLACLILTPGAAPEKATGPPDPEGTSGPVEETTCWAVPRPLRGTASPTETWSAYLQAAGLHFEPSGSRLKCELVMNGWFRYIGSSTIVVTTSHSSPLGDGKRSKYSVILAFSL